MNLGLFRSKYRGRGHVHEAHRLMQVVNASEEVTKVSSGGTKHWRVAETRRVPDKRSSELG